MPYFEYPTSVEITKSRWTVEIEVYDSGVSHRYIVSADSSVADSGIWFGTKEEYEEY